MRRPEDIQTLQAARVAAQQGKLELADTLYLELAARPDFRLEALGFLAFHRFVQQRYDESCRYAAEVVAVRPDDRARINLALSQFGAGDFRGSAETLSQLSDPDFGYAMLLRGALLQRRGNTEQALDCFESALSKQDRLAGHSTMPPLLEQLFALARSTCKQYLRSVHQRLIDELIKAHGAEPLTRIRRTLAHYHDRSEPWQHDLQRPSFLYVPGLPPTPWFERTGFAWADEFERRSEEIGAEYEAIVARHRQYLRPYITAGQDAPQSSWGHLIETDNWLSLHLMKGGKRVEPNASDMPRTMAALNSIELPECAGNAPEAFFSTLAPGTRIPPHHGLSNCKLVVHLALKVPDDCGIRVGGQERRWNQGRCLFFDDSFLHEAWNNSRQERTVLIFDVWHPGLTSIEKSALTKLFAPIDAFFNHRLARLERA